MLIVGASPGTIEYVIIARNLDTSRPILIPLSLKMKRLGDRSKIVASMKRSFCWLFRWSFVWRLEYFVYQEFVWSRSFAYNQRIHNLASQFGHVVSCDPSLISISTILCPAFQLNGSWKFATFHHNWDSHGRAQSSRWLYSCTTQCLTRTWAHRTKVFYFLLIFPFHSYGTTDSTISTKPTSHTYLELSTSRISHSLTITKNRQPPHIRLES